MDQNPADLGTRGIETENLRSNDLGGTVQSGSAKKTTRGPKKLRMNSNQQFLSTSMTRHFALQPK